MTDIAGQYRNDPLMRKVSLGLDLEHFLTQHKIGMYLMERAVQDRARALEQLALADPSDVKQIMALQMQALIPDKFSAWIEEALSDAVAAEEQITLEESSDFN